LKWRVRSKSISFLKCNFDLNQLHNIQSHILPSIASRTNERWRDIISKFGWEFRTSLGTCSHPKHISQLGQISPFHSVSHNRHTVIQNSHFDRWLTIPSSLSIKPEPKTDRQSVARESQSPSPCICYFFNQLHTASRSFKIPTLLGNICAQVNWEPSNKKVWDNPPWGTEYSSNRPFLKS